MEVTKCLTFIIIGLLTIQIANAEKPKNEIKTEKPPKPYNPLEDLILNQNNGIRLKSSSRVKRQYGPYYPYPLPIPIIIGGIGGGGGYGRGFGRGYGGRGFGGRGFGGRGFGGRGFGGFGGRGGFGGFGGRGGRG